VFNPRQGKKERIGKLVRMHSNKREELTGVQAGDIVAVTGLKWSRTGDTLCDEKHPLLLEPITFPEPVVFVAVEPRTKADETRLNESLDKLMLEDPSFLVHEDEDTGQTIISGMGELHLEVLVERLRSDYKVEVRVGRPQVAYRETITSTCSGKASFEKPVGGKVQYASVELELWPLEAGGGHSRFENRTAGDVIPEPLADAAREGVLEAMGSGSLAGYPVTRVGAALVGGEVREPDSTELAFRVAGAMAFREAFGRGEPVLMEPVMSMEIVTPEEFVGDVINDFNARRAKVQEIEHRTEVQAVQGVIPLRETFGYATDLRSLTQGRASYTMQFLRFEPLAPGISAKILGSG
jgi:elongation factor G